MLPKKYRLTRDLAVLSTGIKHQRASVSFLTSFLVLQFILDTTQACSSLRRRHETDQLSESDARADSRRQRAASDRYDASSEHAALRQELLSVVVQQLDAHDAREQLFAKLIPVDANEHSASPPKVCQVCQRVFSVVKSSSTEDSSAENDILPLCFKIAYFQL